jgi:hypothetical protein
MLRFDNPLEMWLESLSDLQRISLFAAVFVGILVLAVLFVWLHDRYDL